MNKFFVVLAIAIAAASCKSLRFLEAESMRNLVDIKGACNIVNAISDTYKKIVSASNRELKAPSLVLQSRMDSQNSPDQERQKS